MICPACAGPVTVKADTATVLHTPQCVLQRIMGRRPEGVGVVYHLADWNELTDLIESAGAPKRDELRLR